MIEKELIHNIYKPLLEDELIEEIAENCKIMEFEEGEIIVDFEQNVKFMPLLLSGAIKIMREDLDGGELFLYFLESGDTCAATMACCIGNRRSEIRATVEKKGKVALVPVQKMEEWLGKYPSWRSFVFNSYHARFNELLNALDNVAFKHLDERLYDYLSEASKIAGSSTINKTHQEISEELNSSRVVISRLLKALEKEGKISLGRNSIEILD